jgi:hypothetical protein
MKFSMLCVGKHLVNVDQINVFFDFDLSDTRLLDLNYPEDSLVFPMPVEKASNFQMGEYYDLKFKLPK